MANTRIYDEVDGLKMIGVVSPGDDVSVGGVTSINTTQDFVDNIDSLSDGVQGPAAVDQAGQQVKFSIETTDILQLIPLLINDLASAEWFGKESGKATWGKGSLVKPVGTTGRFSFQRGQYATINVDGQCVFADGTKTFKDVEGFVVAQAAPTLTRPSRYWEAKTFTHGALAPLHVQSMSFSIAGRVLVDRDAGDIGITVVDVAGYTIGSVELTFRDSLVIGSGDLATALLENGVKDLACTFAGVAGATDQVLTLRNVIWRSKQKAGGRDWTGHTLSGVMQWQDPLTPFKDRILDAAIAADRMINFANVA